MATKSHEVWQWSEDVFPCFLGYNSWLSFHLMRWLERYQMAWHEILCDWVWQSHLQCPLIAKPINTEKLAGFANVTQHAVRGIPQSTNDEGNLIVFISSWERGGGESLQTDIRWDVLTRKKWPPQEQFSQHTSQGPHVNGLSVGQTQDDLRGSTDTHTWGGDWKEESFYL